MLLTHFPGAGQSLSTEQRVSVGMQQPPPGVHKPALPLAAYPASQVTPLAVRTPHLPPAATQPATKQTMEDTASRAASPFKRVTADVRRL